MTPKLWQSGKAVCGRGSAERLKNPSARVGWGGVLVELTNDLEHAVRRGVVPTGNARWGTPQILSFAGIRNTKIWKSVNLAWAVRISGDGGQGDPWQKRKALGAS